MDYENESFDMFSAMRKIRSFKLTSIVIKHICSDKNIEELTGRYIVT